MKKVLSMSIDCRHCVFRSNSSKGHQIDMYKHTHLGEHPFKLKGERGYGVGFFRLAAQRNFFLQK